ncbi:MAG: hypothetical protein Kow0069_06180 [Promethearchaeota archaeon]
MDLTKASSVKKRDLVNLLRKFFKRKAKFAKSAGLQEGLWGVFFFQQGGGPYFMADQPADRVVEVVKRAWDPRNLEQTSYLENGLFYLLSYVTESFTKRAGRALRLIVLSDAPSQGDVSDESAKDQKTRALLDLVDRCKFFPTHVDVVRIGRQKFYEDDVKLRLISVTTDGGLFYVEDAKALSKVLDSLVVPKSVSEESRMPAPEYVEFYEKLATDLVPGEGVGECCVCGSKISPHGEEGSRKYACYNCAVAYHEYCAAEFSSQNPVGFPHVFRCKNCGVLLKVKSSLLPLVGAGVVERRTGGSTGLGGEVVPSTAGVRVLRCSNCRAKIPPGKFCPFCGALVEL